MITFVCVMIITTLQKLGTGPNWTELRTRLYVHFTALSPSITNWFERTAFEGLMITQMNPTLNVQLKFVNQISFF